jgi:hypothetical protein
MNQVFPGTTAKDRPVAAKASASMRVNLEFVSNEIDDSEWQYEKHDEQRI